jgi:hypothetical protein
LGKEVTLSAEQGESVQSRITDHRCLVFILRIYFIMTNKEMQKNKRQKQIRMIAMNGHIKEHTPRISRSEKVLVCISLICVIVLLYILL